MTIDAGQRDATLGLDASIERRGLRDHVYDRILQLLLSGEVAPSARLSIDTIARELRVSPTPVREAMVQLERTGLVTRQAHKGYRMAPPLDESQLAELFDARLMLETTAARLATPADDDFLAELRVAQVAHEQAGARVATSMSTGAPDVAATTDYFARDADFHRVVFAHCGNHYLNEMSEALGGQLHRMRQSVLHGVLDVNEAVAEHAAIVDAFSESDPDAPERAMRRHIEQVRARSLDIERTV